MRSKKIIVLAFVCGTYGTALAVTPADKCEADKLKRAGQYSFCRLKAEAKAVKSGAAPDYSKCDGRFNLKWADAETQGGGLCPTNGDAAAMQARVTDDANHISTCLNGTCPTGCGDGVKNGTDSCDGSDLGGATCASLGYTLGGILACTLGCGYEVSGCQSQAFAATGQTMCWDTSGSVVACAGTGHDGDVQAGAPPDCVDNGDGTITDMNTGLMWGKLSDDGSIHDRDNLYSWNDAFAVHVATLNSGSFAGHTDWRVPNVKELHSLVDYTISFPAVPAALNDSCMPGCTVLTCSCTSAEFYWSSTSFVPGPFLAWVVTFDYGVVTNQDKVVAYRVRAVRGGS